MLLQVCGNSAKTLYEDIIVDPSFASVASIGDVSQSYSDGGVPEYVQACFDLRIGMKRRRNAAWESLQGVHRNPFFVKETIHVEVDATRPHL